MKLIFVYNAKSGAVNGLIDIGHKIISPQTYSCSLCALTHGNFSEKKEWKNIRENSGIEMEFLHKDEFLETYKLEAELPAVFISDCSVKQLISAKELNNLSSLNSLIELVNNKIN